MGKSVGNLIRVERGLDFLNFDNNILNYVQIAYLYGNGNQLFSHGDRIPESSMDYIRGLDNCICGKKNILHKYLIVHKDKLGDYKASDIIAIGSECAKSILCIYPDVELKSNLDMITCQSMLHKKCVLNRKNQSLLSYMDNEEVRKYYKNSSLWKNCKVCYDCSHDFKKLLISPSPSDKFTYSIYECLKDNTHNTHNGKLKKLQSYINFLKQKKLCNSTKWRDWIVVANAVLPPVEVA